MLGIIVTDFDDTKSNRKLVLQIFIFVKLKFCLEQSTMKDKATQGERWLFEEKTRTVKGCQSEETPEWKVNSQIKSKYNNPKRKLEWKIRKSKDDNPKRRPRTKSKNNQKIVNENLKETPKRKNKDDKE